MPEPTSTAGGVAGILWWLSIAAALEYFWISGEAVIIMSVLLLLDFVMWIAEVWLKDRENLSSTKARQGLFKKMTRWCLPFIIVIVIRWAWIENVDYLSTAVCWIIIASEWYSILAHIYTINSDTNEHLPEVDALSAIIKWVSNFFKKAIEDKTPIWETKKGEEEK